MTRNALLLHGLRFHARRHLGVVLGAATATAILVGALVVGDSVRGSLRDRALARIGTATGALDGHDRLFTTALAGQHPNRAALLRVAGLAARADGAARAGHIDVFGVEPGFWNFAVHPPRGTVPDDAVWLGEPLARRLGARTGETVVVRVHKPGALSLDAVIAPRDDASVALRLRVDRVLRADEFGEFGLQPGRLESLDAFVAASVLAKATALPGRANILLTMAGRPSDDPADRPAHPALEREATLADLELDLRARAPSARETGGVPTAPSVELTSRRIFLEPAAVRGAAAVPGGVPVLTYLVNGLAAGDRFAPYSMVAAAGAPYTPEGMGDDEILVNEWLAEDLAVRAGDRVVLTYYAADTGSRLVEGTNAFRVRAVVPAAGIHGDRTLMPEFPGLAKAESTHEWDAGFELVHKFRDKDDRYWRERRGTPKAFVTLAAGQRMWANRFGNLTAVRWFAADAKAAEGRVADVGAALRRGLDPAEFGLRFEPVRAQALAAASGGTAKEFGGLFVGFSFFLIGSALLLTSLLFRFGLEQRATEIGTLLALGWPVPRVRGLFLREGILLAATGSLAGAVAGPLYGWTVVRGLNTVWADAVAGTVLSFHASAASIGSGMAGGVLVAAGTLWLALRRLVARPARELLNEGAAERAWRVGTGAGTAVWQRALPWALGLGGIGLALGGTRLGDAEKPGAFFGAGALLLAGGLLGLRAHWRRPRPTRRLSRLAFAGRAPARQPTRSLATVGLLACATFLLASVAAFRLDVAGDPTRRDTGTGGFAFWAETALPVTRDLNTARGLEGFGIGTNALPGVSVVPMRVRDGDETSCLNLGQPGRPRLLGVDAGQLARRGAFSFAKFAEGVAATRGWRALDGPADADEIPAIGDDASIQWALQKRLGDRLEFTDDRGRAFRVRLVGAVANSILQGSLLVDEAAFLHRFPNEAGHRAFLVDAPPATAAAAAATLTRALDDVGFEAVPARDRLARFNAVQNTYLNTFQALGGLGLLLGSVGIGVVVLRNVHERRAELAVLGALGFEAGLVRRLVLAEHAVLVAIGLGLGFLAAMVAVFPSLTTGSLPLGGLALTLLAVGANGLVFAAIATWRACRGSMLEALRGE